MRWASFKEMVRSATGRAGLPLGACAKYSCNVLAFRKRWDHGPSAERYIAGANENGQSRFSAGRPRGFLRHGAAGRVGASAEFSASSSQAGPKAAAVFGLDRLTRGRRAMGCGTAVARFSSKAPKVEGAESDHQLYDSRFEASFSTDARTLSRVPRSKYRLDRKVVVVVETVSGCSSP